MATHQQSSFGASSVRTVLLGSMLAFAVTTTVIARESFPYPEVAMDSFVNAVKSGDQAALANVLGSNYKQYIPEALNRDIVDTFLAAWSDRHRIALYGNSAWLEVGASQWRLPIPVVQTQGAWHFDLVAGADEMQRRKLGRNELGAITALQLLHDAQTRYRQTQGRYATQLVSEPGERNGLYWPEADATASSPLGADALAMTADTPADSAYSGYHFKVLPGAHASTYSIVAWPAEYGVSGVHSFQVKPDGAVSESVSQLNADTTSTQGIQWKRVE